MHACIVKSCHTKSIQSTNTCVYVRVCACMHVQSILQYFAALYSTVHCSLIHSFTHSLTHSLTHPYPTIDIKTPTPLDSNPESPFANSEICVRATIIVPFMTPVKNRTATAIV